MEQQGPKSAGAALLALVWRRRRMSFFLFLLAVEHARGLMGPLVLLSNIMVSQGLL